MKTKYSIIALAFTFLVMINYSCSEEFLDQKPTSSFYEQNYYKNVDELNSGLVACYASLRQPYYSSYDIMDWTIGDIGSDDADCGSFYSDQPDLYNISYSRQNTSNYWVFLNWLSYYGTIATCNKVIDRSPGTEGDTTDIRRIVNEAKFLRALIYYNLVTRFGAVPLVTKFLLPAELTLPRAPEEEVWKQIESDLKDATELPDKSYYAEPGHATSGAAWSLLGKCYLTEQKYDLANQAFSMVVNSGQYSLVDDYGYIFRKEGQNCEESVFEMQTLTNLQSGGNLCSWSAPFRLPRDDRGWGYDCPTEDLLSEFEPGDPRVIYTFIFKGDVFPKDDYGDYIAENSESPTGYNARKAWIPYDETNNLGWDQWAINYRILRYAEVLLLYAESLNETDQPNAALSLLNQVRARARITPAADPQRISCVRDLSYTGELLPDVTTTDKTQLREAIWHEQRVELAIEGHRRNMLLRIGQFKERMETAKAYAEVTLEPYHNLLPIPMDEIRLSNNVLTQNPGY
ncbi:MAG: RagB/SusD family nutrient uptake outer membrane protein [Bacteroidales bacterium]